MLLNRTYNFSLYPNSVIGSSFNNLKVLAILDYNNAIKYSNIELINRQIKPYLPPGTPTNHFNYTYYLFNYKDKDLVIAEEWIIPSSIEEVTTTSVTIRLNNISTYQYNLIRDQLRLLGISFDIL